MSCVLYSAPSSLPPQALLLHGEQYLEMHAPLPTSGKLLTTARVLDTQDKGKAAVVVIHTVSRYAVLTCWTSFIWWISRSEA